MQANQMKWLTTAHVSVPWWPRSKSQPCPGYKHLPYRRIARVLRTLTRTESTRYEFVVQPELSFPGNLYIRDGFFIHTPKLGTCLRSWCPTQGGRAQPHIPASAAPGSCRGRQGPAPQILRSYARANL